MSDATRVFDPGGPLARVLPSFEARPQQARMASAVMEALRSGRHLVVEAGTGVGKSLAYLVPAILWSAEEGADPPGTRRVVVSTHTRALQEQLARKDLPLLERALRPAGVVFRSALLMGSENYLCVQRLRQELLQRRLGDDPGARCLGDLERHAATAVSGLRSEIPFPVPDPVWSRVRRERDVCLGARGPFWEECLYRRDLLRSREARILVVNHALFFLDLATGGRILPPHGAAILDEAHRAEEAAAAQLGLSLSDHAVRRLLEDLGAGRTAEGRARRGARARAVGGALGEPFGPAVRRAMAEVERASARFFTGVRAAAETIVAARGRPERVSGAPRDGGFQARVREPGVADDLLGAPLRDLEEELRLDAGARAGAAEGATVAALAERARDLRERAALFLSQGLPDSVYWIEASARRAGATLRATPIEVAPFLRRHLFEGERTVVLTSATLSAAGSFAHLRRRLGVGAAETLALGSPFDFERQALLYLPRSLPDPVSEAEAFAEAVAPECRRILQACGGGAFILFTSYALLGRVHDRLATDPALGDLRFLRHDPGSASAVLEEFRATRRGVLFGTLTFWQGVDVPGEALRCVVITRLPFEVPDDPVAEARAEATRARGGDPFQEESLPAAILTFRQGFGRLIRTREDRGLVAVLDPRLSSRSYGRDFLASLPPCRRTESIEEVRSFFAAPAAPARVS